MRKPATLESLFRWFNRRRDRHNYLFGRKAGIYVERFADGSAEVQFAETEFEHRIFGLTLRAALIEAREVAKHFDKTRKWRPGRFDQESGAKNDFLPWLW